MSLRDQLLAKGLASKKDARRVEQEQRDERKRAQGNMRSQADLRREEAAAAAAVEAAAHARRVEEKRRRDVAREADEREHRIRQILGRNRIRGKGPIRFFHRTLDGARLGRVDVSELVAWKLRAGECAIIGVPGPVDVEYAVVNARAAVTLSEFAPELVVFWTRDTSGLSDPALAVYKPEAEISLKPHRA